jgi:mannose-1-phosphate guanylyltransferase/mannose-6-phosphate isomerase
MPPATNVHALILAGGSGTRLWPLSTDARPKPFLRLAGDESLLRQTFGRASALAGAGNVWISGRASHGMLIRRELPEVAESHLVLEPRRRNTAPAIALSALAVEAEAPGAVLAVLPSDQAVADESVFAASLVAAAAAARKVDAIVTLGIPPTRPETGFGYVEVEDGGSPGSTSKGEKGIDLSPRSVVRFVEKPSRETAEGFVRGGRHFWNAGIFVFRPSVLFEEMRRSCPAVLDAARRAEEARRAGNLSSFGSAFSSSPSVSIDVAVMEKASRVLTVPSPCGWSDLGSWQAVWEFRAKDRNANAASGGASFVGAASNLVLGSGKPVCVIGLSDVAIVESENGLLVTRRDASDELRAWVEASAKEGRK